MKKLLSIVCIWLMSIQPVMSNSIETNLYYSSDSDNTVIEKYDSRYINDSGYIFGIGQNVYNVNGNSVRLDKAVLGFRNELLTIVSEVDEEGNIGGLATFIIPSDIYMELGIERELIDSENGLTDRLSSTVYYFNIDLYHEGIDAGLSLVPSYTNFDEGGSRNQLRTKLYKGIGETGFHVYVRTRNYWNSDPYNGVFFSPEEYEQYLVGFGFRRVLGEHTVVSGHYDMGRQYIDGYGEPSNTWRLSLNSNITDSISISIDHAVDNYSPNYTYELSTASIVFHF